MKSLKDRYYRLRGEYRAWRERQLHKAAELLVRHSGFKARKPLRALGTPMMLVDTSVFGHAVTHETAWITTGTKLWGGVHPVDTGYAARIPVHSRESDSRVYREVCYLLGIASLHQQGHLRLRTSAEIRAEIHRQPAGRFTGYGWQDLCILHWGDCPTIDGHHFDFMGDAKATQISRVARCKDPVFLELAALFPQKMSLDAYHIYTASKHKVPYYLHIDFPLAERAKQIAKKPEFKRLGVEVLLPSQFGERFGLIKVPPVVISHRDRKFFVRTDLHWEDNRRQKPKRRDSS